VVVSVQQGGRSLSAARVDHLVVCVVVSSSLLLVGSGCSTFVGRSLRMIRKLLYEIRFLKVPLLHLLSV
jgi:hypothetical protein